MMGAIQRTLEIAEQVQRKYPSGGARAQAGLRVTGAALPGDLSEAMEAASMRGFVACANEAGRPARTPDRPRTGSLLGAVGGGELS